MLAVVAILKQYLQKCFNISCMERKNQQSKKQSYILFVFIQSYNGNVVLVFEYWVS